MSRHHRAHSGDVTHLIEDIKEMPAEDVARLYGIQINKDGSVFDTTFGKQFMSLRQWAENQIEEDEMEYEEDINQYKDDSRPI